MKEGKYFHIQSFLNDLVLELKDKDGRSGKAVTTATCSASDLQLFYIDDVTGTIRNKTTDLCLDISGGVVVAKPYNSASAQQRWCLQHDHVRSSLDENVVIDIANEETDAGASLIPYAYKSSPNQRWKFIHVTATGCLLVNKESGLVLTTGGQSQPVTLSVADKKNEASHWYENRWGIVTSFKDNTALEVNDGKLFTNPRERGQLSQQWIMTPDGALMNKHNRRMALEVVNKQYKIAEFQKNPNQIWTFDPIDSK